MKLHRRLPVLALLAMTCLPACSGRQYDQGIVSHENVHWGLFQFGRNERRVHYAVLWEHLLNSGSSWAGNQYISALGGAVLTVNVPGLTWVLLYPFQYSDLTDSGAHVFGIGSGDGDFRVSLLWGMISLGRNWNVFWLNGFWAGSDDPLYSEPPPEVLAEFDSHVIGAEGAVMGASAEPAGAEPAGAEGVDAGDA